MTVVPVADPVCDAPAPSAGIVVQPWTEREFEAGRAQWQELLARSDAHPLFMSWAWQHGWWQLFVRERAHALVLAAYTPDGMLVGLAPLRLTRRRLKAALRAERLTFLAGDNVLEGVLTEYQSFILDRRYARAIARALMKAAVENAAWDEAVFELMDPRSAEYEGVLLEACRGMSKSSTEDDASRQAYLVDTTGSLDAYKASLSQSTRRRLFNLRTRLTRDHGGVRFERASVAEMEGYLDRLNDLHARRWGKPALSPQQTQFVLALANELEPPDGLELSRLVIAGQTRSVLLSYRAGRTECNLQQGYEEEFDRKLPLGYIHFGYALERAFESPGVDSYDFLVGRGKHSNYKAPLATSSVTLPTFHVVRKPALRLAYAIRDWLRQARGST